jgi:hypothetical protein
MVVKPNPAPPLIEYFFPDIPATFRGWDVIDGDDTDVRHIEPKTVVVGLYAKGKAKRDISGFTQIAGMHY